MNGAWREAAGLRFVELETDDSGPDLPVVFTMHGRGADPTDLASLAPAVSPNGYRWILPQGLRPVRIGPGEIGWAWYELDERQAATVVESRDRLATFIDETLARLAMPRGRAALIGFSQGAVMALHVGLASDESFGAIIAMSGHLPAAEVLLPLLPKRQDRHVLIIHGTYDQVLPVERGRHVRDVLQQAGLNPEYHEFPMDHQITPESIEVVRQHLTRALPPGSSA
ncbi:MAG: hypothetical protein GEU73_10580 [Chloroflexi bacterium]|nr:hypothetical protein [Chloroflexota bacterium]